MKDDIQDACFTVFLQSSFTKPVLDGESVPVDNVQDYSQLKCGESYPSETKMQEVETCIQLGQKSIMHDGHAKGRFL